MTLNLLDFFFLIKFFIEQAVALTRIITGYMEESDSGAKAEAIRGTEQDNTS